jgi:hypothetical protein
MQVSACEANQRQGVVLFVRNFSVIGETMQRTVFGPTRRAVSGGMGTNVSDDI